MTEQRPIWHINGNTYGAWNSRPAHILAVIPAPVRLRPHRLATLCGREVLVNRYSDDRPARVCARCKRMAGLS